LNRAGKQNPARPDGKPIKMIVDSNTHFGEVLAIPNNARGCAGFDERYGKAAEFINERTAGKG
jgi:hypothetical protein